MKTVNTVTLLGCVGTDPIVNRKDGVTYATFTMSTIDEEKTQWHTVSYINALAEICEKYVRKGMKVFVKGRLIYSSWERDGQKRTKAVIHADELVLLTRKEAEYDGENG